MIEFSCHTWAFNDLTLQEALGTIARLGFRYADLGSGPHLNAVKAAADPRRVAAEIVGDLRVYNLKLADVYVMLPRIAAPDEAVRQREIDLFKAMLPCLHLIGTPGVTLSPGVPPQPPTPADDWTDAQKAEAIADYEAAHEAAYVHARTALTAMIEAAQGELAVSIEPHLDSLAQDISLALRFVEEVPGLKLTLDWAHPVCQGLKHDDIIRMLPHTRHVHLRQAAKAQLQTTFRRGRLRLEQVMQALREANYQQIVCVEYMKTPGWHGMAQVNTLVESVQLRDALRELRDAQPESRTS